MTEHPHQVSVFGLGYVGSVTAACSARLGHKVVGVDVNPAKVERHELTACLRPGQVVVGFVNLEKEHRINGALSYDGIYR